MASKEVTIKSHKYTISYEIFNPTLEPCILILHGWGANKEIMKKAFLPYFTNLKQIYIDLPGFGNSPLTHPLYTKDYAHIVREFLDKLNLKPEFVLGHSFGGKVATLLNPPNLVLLSSAGIIQKKPFLVRLKIKIFKFLKFIGFGKFYKFFASKDVAGMSKEMYETLKNVVDENFYNIFKNYKGKAYLFWGKEDRATPLKSGEEIARIIKNSEFYPLNGDHFFFLLHTEFITKTIQNRDQKC
ncbi:alpha/beta fold hydrolase [Campylobacter hyointestinalis]|uniref:alpha/beta fold hydrolase n=1 Tax=Campylobacter hyointestinalis TaxID=198 RepID=UPI0007280680|nr:alpha/beta hydrolase [Campylobacter hyointestinalis]CUU70337.1 alpha/beta hydrolase [Campylobacter hyointestinalis subsp. hyointestinalis]